MIIANITIITLDATNLFESNQVYTVGTMKIAQAFVILITSLFLLSTISLSFIPLTNKQFTITTTLIVIGGTSLGLPSLVQYMYDDRSVSYLLAFLLALLAPLLTYVVSLLMRGNTLRREKSYIWKNEDLSYREKLRRLRSLERKHQYESNRLKSIRPAFLPWIYYRKQP